MMRSGSLTTRLEVNLYETERLNQMVRQFGLWHNLPEETLFMISLSLDELVTNIVVHASQKDPEVHEIFLRLRAENGELMAEIEDDGCAFNPLDLPEPDIHSCLQDRCPGGLGIHLARKFMDHIEYCRVGRRNLLILTKRVTELP